MIYEVISNGESKENDEKVLAEFDKNFPLFLEPLGEMLQEKVISASEIPRAFSFLSAVFGINGYTAHAMLRKYVLSQYRAWLLESGDKVKTDEFGFILPGQLGEFKPLVDEAILDHLDLIVPMSVFADALLLNDPRDAFTQFKLAKLPVVEFPGAVLLRPDRTYLEVEDAGPQLIGAMAEFHDETLFLTKDYVASLNNTTGELRVAQHDVRGR